MTNRMDHRQLQNIVAMLFSFACMAFRASIESDAKRRLTLWTLRPAAACACDYIIGVSIDRRAYALTESMMDDASPEDAIHLAQTFCVLAVLHHYMLALPGTGREDLRVWRGLITTAFPRVSWIASPSAGGGGCARQVAAAGQTNH